MDEEVYGNVMLAVDAVLVVVIAEAVVVVVVAINEKMKMYPFVE